MGSAKILVKLGGFADPSNVDARSLAASKFQIAKTRSEPKYPVNGQLLLNKRFLCDSFSLVAFFCYIRNDNSRSAMRSVIGAQTNANLLILSLM